MYRDKSLCILGALLQGPRRLMSYKLALQVLAAFTEQVVPIHNLYTLYSEFPIRNKNSHNEANEKASSEVI